MLSTPQLIDRPAQPYVAIPARVTMQQMMDALPRLWPEVATWLAERGIAPSGAPLIRWVVIDMPGEMLIEVGMPIAEAVAGDARVIAGHLPAGRYAVAVHSGHYDELVAAHAALQDWAAQERVAWAVEHTPEGEAWHARIESYTTDPAAVPNPADWQTEIAYLVAVAPAEPTRGPTRKPRPAARPKRRAPRKAAKKTKRAATKPKRAARKAKRAPAEAKRRATKKAKRRATKKPKRRATKKPKRRATKKPKRPATSRKRRAPKR